MPIIQNSEGRHASVRTPREDEEALLAQIEALSPHERALLEAVLHEMDAGMDDGSLMEIMGEHRYVRQPVSIEQWLDDDYYMGESTQTLYPGIRDVIVDVFEVKGYREVAIGGAIGTGKTTSLALILNRIVYEMSCLRAPQLAYGLSPGSEIVVAMISLSLPLARTVVKSACEDKLRLSPYFQEVFPFDSKSDQILFPNRIQMMIGSCYSTRILGTNLFAGGMDETNFMQSKKSVMGAGATGVEGFDLAEKTFTSMNRRIKSRFMDRGGDLPGMSVIVSSANVENSFTDRYIARNRESPHVFVREFSAWDVKPEQFGLERFRVLVGHGAIRSRVLEDGEPDPVKDIEAGGKLVEVPTEYLEDFERDLEGSIRDIAGISTTAISPFLHRVEKVQEAADPTMKHPFSVGEWVYGTEGSFVWGLLSERKTRRVRGYEETYWVPKNAPDEMRHIHIDVAVSGDCLGMAMGYIDRWVEVSRRDSHGERHEDIAPLIVVEFMLRVVPPVGDQIFLPDIRALVYELQDHGFEFTFSSDSFQSTDTLQQMRARGVTSTLISCDRSTVPYDQLKTALYENRVRTYEYRPFRTEVTGLEYNRAKGKVDHKIHGRKDVADAVAGVVYALSNRSTAGVRLGHVAPMHDDGVHDDYSWVTDGKIPVTPGMDVDTEVGEVAPVSFIVG